MKIKYILLFLIIPVSLYINFFIFNITLWKIYIRAWLIYSLFIIVGEILILILLNNIIKILISNKIKIDSKKYIYWINIAFILGNIFFIVPLHNKLWYLVPVFQNLLIFLFSILFFDKTSRRKNRLTFKKMFFTIDSKIKNRKEKFLLIFKISLLSFILTTLLNITILKIYDPHLKSMRYYEKEFKAKLSTNYKTLPF